MMRHAQRFGPRGLMPDHAQQQGLEKRYRMIAGPRNCDNISHRGLQRGNAFRLDRAADIVEREEELIDRRWRYLGFGSQPANGHRLILPRDQRRRRCQYPGARGDPVSPHRNTYLGII